QPVGELDADHAGGADDEDVHCLPFLFPAGDGPGTAVAAIPGCGHLFTRLPCVSMARSAAADKGMSPALAGSAPSAPARLQKTVPSTLRDGNISRYGSRIVEGGCVGGTGNGRNRA